MAVIVERDRGDERDRVLRAASDLAATAFAPERGTVERNRALEDRARLALGHRLISWWWMSQAVGSLTPRWRLRASADRPVLAGLMREMARNPTVSLSWVPCKTVPAIRDVCWRQALHWNILRRAPRTTQCAAAPRPGRRKPSGQRVFSRAPAHWDSVPNGLKNPDMDRPAWNGIRFIATVKPSEINSGTGYRRGWLTT